MDNHIEFIIIRGGRLFDPSQKLDMLGDLVLGQGKILWWGKQGGMPQKIFETLY